LIFIKSPLAQFVFFFYFLSIAQFVQKVNTNLSFSYILLINQKIFKKIIDALHVLCYNVYEVLERAFIFCLSFAQYVQLQD